MAKRNSCTDCAHKRGQDCLKTQSTYWDGVEGVEKTVTWSLNFKRDQKSFCTSHEPKPTVWERIKAVVIG